MWCTVRAGALYVLYELRSERYEVCGAITQVDDVCRCSVAQQHMSWLTGHHRLEPLEQARFSVPIELYRCVNEQHCNEHNYMQAPQQGQLVASAFALTQSGTRHEALDKLYAWYRSLDITSPKRYLVLAMVLAAFNDDSEPATPEDDQFASSIVTDGNEPPLHRVAASLLQIRMMIAGRRDQQQLRRDVIDKAMDIARSRTDQENGNKLVICLRGTEWPVGIERIFAQTEPKEMNDKIMALRALDDRAKE